MRRSATVGGSLIIAAGVFVSACVSQQPSNQASNNRPYVLSEVEQKIVKFDVAMKLKDPGSPMFGNMAASVSEKGVVQVCGTVNAKNGFGAYTGLQPYIGVMATSGAGNRVFVTNGIGVDDYSARAIIMTCHRYGIGNG